MATSADPESATRTSLNGHGIFAIIVFATVALICIQPIHIPIPQVITKKADQALAKLLGVRANKDIGPQDSEQNKHRAEQPASSQERNGNDSANTQRESQSLPNAAQSCTRRYIVLDHVWTPAIGILFLLATKTIGGEQIKLGIVGEDDIEPYDVLALFLGLAYIAISLDATGLLRYLAFQVCLKAGTNGRTLYLILYAFFWTLGVLVGNDPVILSGTAFLVYLTRVAGISPPSAWIWAQFVAANISSAVLVSSNPTNLVIASGFRISFPIYTAYMILPAFVSALVSLLVLLLFFRNKNIGKRRAVRRQHVNDATDANVNSQASGFVRARPVQSRNIANNEDGVPLQTMPSASKEHGLSNRASEQIDDADDSRSEESWPSPIIYIPKTIIRPDVDARSALVDPYGAVFASIVMAGTLITLIATSVTGGVKVYVIAAPGAALCLVRDIVHDVYTWRTLRRHRQKMENSDAERSTAQPEAATGNEWNEAARQANPNVPSSETVKPPQLESQAQDGVHVVKQLVKIFAHIVEVFPTVSYVAARLPLPLLPFAFGMFILVQSLAHVGFVNILAKGLGNVCTHGYVGCSFFLSTLGVILCNLGGTNIGATILLTKALQTSFFKDRLEPSQAALILKAASFSVAFGSNVGALGGTFAASLAGLLWRDGLRQRGVLVTKLQFVKWCAVVIVPALVSGVAVLLPEVRYYKL